MVDPVEPFRTRLLNSFIRQLHSEDLEDLDIDWAEYRRRVTEGPPSLTRFLAALGELWAEKHGKSRWGEKTPTHVYYLELFKSMFPKMKVVNAVRDPRAVAASWLNTKITQVSDPAAVALEWRRSILAAERAGQNSDVPVITVRYEDLVADPERELRSICDFTSLSYDGSMLDFHEDAENHAPQQQWMASLERPLHDENVHRWRDELEKDDVLLLEALVLQALERYGYEMTSSESKVRRLREVAQRVERAYVQSAGADMRPMREMLPIDVEAYRGLLEG
jgi:hypothetical protein